MNSRLIFMATRQHREVAESAWAPTYERLKQQWVHEHPDATPREYEQAMREIAARCGL